MRRRKVFLELGSLAGASGVIGSGAFTSVSAQRTIDVKTVADADGDCEAGVSDPVPQILGLADGLLSYWPLDSIGDDTAEDIVGGNNGTPQNGVSLTGGHVNDSADFDGIDDYVNVPDDPSLDLTDALTLAAWVKPSQDLRANYLP
jgi:hypothetical protein